MNIWDVMISVQPQLVLKKKNQWLKKSQWLRKKLNKKKLLNTVIVEALIPLTGPLMAIGLNNINQKAIR